MTVVVKVLIIDVRVDEMMDFLAGVWIVVIVAVVFVIALALVLSMPYFVYMLFDALVDSLTRLIMRSVPNIGVEVLAGANTNVFTSRMPSLEFVAPES